MKILYIAFACDPNKGSEAQCGWAWPKHMKDYADVFILTRSENKTSIETYIKENNIKNITALYFDIPNWMNPYYKFGKMYHAYYVLWQILSYTYIRKIVSDLGIDIVHQITLGDFRIINGAWKTSAKFYFGPVGGAQVTPDSLKEYAIPDKKAERTREIINKIVGLRRQYRKALDNSTYVFAANKETQQYLSKIMKNPDKCVLLTENGISDEALVKSSKTIDQGGVTLLWAGRMVNRKGLDFLIDIIPSIKTDKKYQVLLVGDGPEKDRLQNKVIERHLDDKVIFLGKVDYDSMREIYNKSQIFVFPSIRETTGTVLFEAMSNSMPVVSFNQNGAAELITDATGIRISIDQDLDNIKRNFAAQLTFLINNPDRVKELGENAYTLVKEKYTWSSKCKTFFETYLENE